MSSNNLKTKGQNYLSAKDITADDYGKYITNYATPCGIEKDTKHGIGGWRIFYADEKNIYLIADDYIHQTFAPKGDKIDKVIGGYRLSMENVLDDYNGTSDIQDRLKSLNKEYFDKGYKSSYKNMKAVAYMLDTEIWDEKFKNTKFAEYAIGGPSLELFVKSYNQVHTDRKIELEVTYEVENGYKIGWHNKKLHDYIDGLDTSKDNMYVITDTSKAYAMWLCSPSATHFYEIFNVYGFGTLMGDCYYNINPGFRPVVCLKSNIQLKKVENGFEINE